MRKVDSEIKQSMRPSNILVHGRSGSGKTEIFRRISKIYNAPFIRVEATKYTEVGYHGDDITNIIVDLFKKTQNEYAGKDAQVVFRSSKTIRDKVDDYVLKCILGPDYMTNPGYLQKTLQLREGVLEEYECYLFQPNEAEAIMHLKVREIKKFLYEYFQEQLFTLHDMETFIKDEIESKGIVVIDEIDKIVRSGEQTSSTKASDEGVQYDLLPLLDGTTVKINSSVKVNTRNILFVGAGAFEKTKPTDLAVELQGRMPIRAKMESLSLEDFKHILTVTEHNLLQQAVELLKTESLNIAFEAGAVDEIARVSVELNEEDNIGARRLRTVVDAVLEDINFEAPDFEAKDCTLVVTAAYVASKTKSLYANRDFRQYVM